MATVEHRADVSPDCAADSARATVELLYTEHASRVYAVCASVLRDRAEAEDAVQQTFISAFCALMRGTEPRDPAAWLVTIARNESWSRVRRPRGVPLAPELEDLFQEDPSISAHRHGELARIWRAIEGLPETQRHALLLRELRGLTYDELAADLQLSGPSVRSLLNRARRSVRTQLERGAALVGAQWLNLFARLFGDASTSTASSASRTAAVGLGALALTGTAVITPSLVTSKHHQPPPPRVVVHHTVAVKPAVTRTAPSVAPRPSAVVDDRTTRSIDRHGESSRDGRSSGDGDRGPGPSALSGSGSGDSGGTSDGSGSDGGHDGSGSDGGHDGSSGSSGSDG